MKLILRILTSIFRYVEQLLGSRAGSSAIGVRPLQGLADGLPGRGAGAGADQRQQQPRGHSEMSRHRLRRQAGLGRATGRIGRSASLAVRLNFFKIAKPNFRAARKPQGRRERHKRSRKTCKQAWNDIENQGNKGVFRTCLDTPSTVVVFEIILIRRHYVFHWCSHSNAADLSVVIRRVVAVAVTHWSSQGIQDSLILFVASFLSAAGGFSIYVSGSETPAGICFVHRHHCTGVIKTP